MKKEVKLIEKIKVKECEDDDNIPVDKHLEKEKGGRRWGLEAEESLSALAVEEAHILSAIRDRD